MPVGTPASAERLVLVGEETLHSMSADEDDPERASGRRLVVTARSVGGGAELEFISATEGENLEDRLAYLGENPEITDGREISYRLLRHLSSSVSHQKYHGVDVVSVRVEVGRGWGRGGVGVPSRKSRISLSPQPSNSRMHGVCSFVGELRSRQFSALPSSSVCGV